MHSPILLPVALLAAWSMIMWVWLYAMRLPAMKRAGLLDTPMVGGTGSDLRQKLTGRDQWPADNFNHLMEQPTVFYAAALVIALTETGHGLNLWLAWAYVALRIVHSLVQATVNRVPLRFALHALGSLPLIALSLHALLAALRTHGN